MPIFIHVDDEQGILNIVARCSKGVGATATRSILVGNPKDPSTDNVKGVVIAAVREATSQGHRIVIVSDYNIGGHHVSADRLWEDVWPDLTTSERGSVTAFIVYCSSGGEVALQRTVNGLADFQGTFSFLSKPADLGDIRACFKAALAP
jgi:hypothetical protein